MAWKEIEQPSIGRDIYGSITGRRVFKVWAFDPHTVLNTPTQVLGGPTGIEPLPDFGTSFDGQNLDIRLARYSTQHTGPEGANTYIATAEFEFDLFEAKHASFQTETVEIPFARMVKSFISGPPTSDPEVPVVLDWKFEKQPILETRIRRGRRVIVRWADLNELVQIIYEQNNKLQRIPSPIPGNGVWYRFEAGDILTLGPGVYSCSYNFILDSGTRLFTTLDGAFESDAPRASFDGRIFYPPLTQVFTELYPLQRYIRPPFTELVIVRGSAAPVPSTPPEPAAPVDPEFRWICPYMISGAAVQGIPDGQGWRTLPGITSGGYGPPP